MHFLEFIKYIKITDKTTGTLIKPNFKALKKAYYQLNYIKNN